MKPKQTKLLDSRLRDWMRISPFCVYLPIFLTLTIVFLASCMTFGDEPGTGDVSMNDSYPQAYTSTESPTLAIPASTVTGEPEKTFEAVSTLDTPTPTLSLVCPTESILYVRTVGEYEKELRWTCIDDLSSQTLVSGIALNNLAVSPQGQHVAFGEKDMINVVDMSTLEIQTLLNGVSDDDIYSPTWSPSGEYIAYLRHTGQPQPIKVEVVHLPTGVISENFIPNEYEEQIVYDTIDSIAWIPQWGQILMFGNYSQDLTVASVTCSDVTYLCTANDIRKLPETRGIEQLPAVSPDGLELATICFKPGVRGDDMTEFCILDRQGNVIHEAEEAELGVERMVNLSWSPSGTQIAFDDYSQIYVLSLADWSVIQLKDVGYDPVWLP